MNPPTPQKQGYPLSSLFLLVALVAAISAHISPLFTASVRPTQWPNITFLCFASGSGGAFLGLVIGLYHYRQRRGVAWGILLGVVFGTLCGPVIASSFVYPWRTMLISVVSTVVILGIAACFRRINDRDPVSRRDAYEAKLRQWKVSRTTDPIPEE